MSLMFLIGGARSGKSSLAVRLAAESGAPVVFIATGEPGDAEMAERIARHRAERPTGIPYKPDNVLTMVYRHLGVDAGRTTITDPTGRPHFLVRDSRLISELS